MQQSWASESRPRCSRLASSAPAELGRVGGAGVTPAEKAPSAQRLLDTPGGARQGRLLSGQLWAVLAGHVVLLTTCPASPQGARGDLKHQRHQTGSEGRDGPSAGPQVHPERGKRVCEAQAGRRATVREMGTALVALPRGLLVSGSESGRVCPPRRDPQGGVGGGGCVSACPQHFLPAHSRAHGGRGGRLG